MRRALRQSLVIASELSNIRQVESFVDEICDQYQIFNEYYGHIMICLTEAAGNAIVHGNALDPKRKVSITFSSRDGALHFEVKDRGKGFDPEQIPDPTQSESGKEGRGLYTIRSLADKVEWSDNGRMIHFSFNTASINQELAIRRLKMLGSYYHQSARKTVF
jgi:serine/threonine-protein kinase RsbW